MYSTKVFATEPHLIGNIDIQRALLPGTDETGYRVEAGVEGGMLVFTGDAGHVGGIDWGCSRYLIVPIFQDTDHSLWLDLRFWEDGGSQLLAGQLPPHASIAMGVFPGFEVQVVVPLTALKLETLFLPRTPGRLKNVSTGTPVEASLVTSFAITIPRSAQPQVIYIGAPRLSSAEPEYRIPETPVVDEIGQWQRKSWPGKTNGVAELVANLKRWAVNPPTPLGGPLSKYGGLTTRQSVATGYFRKEHDGDRWWLIDPDGHPFFSVGPDCVEPDCSGTVEGLEKLFKWLPARDGEFADAWSETRSGNSVISFSVANLIRAFGEHWHDEWYRITEARLRHWGFNTIANWSEPGIGKRFQMPYVAGMASFPTTKQRIFRDLPDVFSPEYAVDAERCAESLRANAEDPYLIGYFLTNEPNWAFGDYNLGDMVLTSPHRLATKVRLVQFLRERYQGNIARLGAAWNVTLNSFDDLFTPVPNASSLSDVAGEDLADFAPIIIDEYVRVPAAAARRVDPNHLCLGLRWAWIASDSFYAGSQYCDVFSINCYQMMPDASEIAKTSRASGLPVMIGEFHAGALDVGLPANALRGVVNQAARGEFYRYYVENAASLPDLVGAHYFQYGDQPVLGRFDGECLNIGLVDVCHKPYHDMTTVIADTHRTLYDVCRGTRPPVRVQPEEMPREGF